MKSPIVRIVGFNYFVKQ